MRVRSTQLPRKLPLKALAIVVGAGALATAGFAAFSWMPASATRAAASEPIVRPARVMEIAYQPHSQSLVLAGTVVPRIESTLGFRVAGKIIARTVDVGTVVKPGDLIAQLDPADFRLAVDNARAALASADADYVRAKADHERYLNLRGTRRVHAADARAAPVARRRPRLPASSRPRASSPRPRTTSPTPSCAPTRRASSPRSRPRSARS